jgi:hypothetical protein
VYHDGSATLAPLGQPKGSLVASQSPPSELLVSVESAALMLGLEPADVERLAEAGSIARSAEHYVLAQSVLDYADRRVA